MNLFQSPEWEQFKLATGYQKSYRIDGVLVLQKKLPLNRTMLYSPMIDISQISNLSAQGGSALCGKSQNYVSKIKTLGRENKTIFYRAEFDFSSQQCSNEAMKQFNFIKSFEEMQPEHTLILDITKSEQDILAQMKPKGRYNIKIAQRNQIQVRKSRQVDNFYDLYQETGRRQKITFRKKEYFQALLDNLEPKGYCELFEAITALNPPAGGNAELTRKDDCHCEKSGSLNSSGQAPQSDSNETMKQCNNETVLAAAIVSFYKGRATYLFGASSDEMRNLMAAYELHWQIILEAKRRSISEYDFFGIAPDDNPKHPWAGISRFKKQFGGKEIQLLGSWDLVLRPTEYQIFKIAERLRRRK